MGSANRLWQRSACTKHSLAKRKFPPAISPRNLPPFTPRDNPSSNPDTPHPKHHLLHRRQFLKVLRRDRAVHPILELDLNLPQPLEPLPLESPPQRRAEYDEGAHEGLLRVRLAHEDPERLQRREFRCVGEDQEIEVRRSEGEGGEVLEGREVGREAVVVASRAGCEGEVPEGARVAEEGEEVVRVWVFDIDEGKGGENVVGEGEEVIEEGAVGGFAGEGGEEGS